MCYVSFVNIGVWLYSRIFFLFKILREIYFLTWLQKMLDSLLLITMYLFLYLNLNLWSDFLTINSGFFNATIEPSWCLVLESSYFISSICVNLILVNCLFSSTNVLMYSALSWILSISCSTMFISSNYGNSENIIR